MHRQIELALCQHLVLDAHADINHYGGQDEFKNRLINSVLVAACLHDLDQLTAEKMDCPLPKLDALLHHKRLALGGDFQDVVRRQITGSLEPGFVCTIQQLNLTTHEVFLSKS